MPHSGFGCVDCGGSTRSIFFRRASLIAVKDLIDLTSIAFHCSNSERARAPFNPFRLYANCRAAVCLLRTRAREGEHTLTLYFGAAVGLCWPTEPVTCFTCCCTPLKLCQNRHFCSTDTLPPAHVPAQAVWCRARRYVATPWPPHASCAVGGTLCRSHRLCDCRVIGTATFTSLTKQLKN
jgi:hypothetical protein